MGWELLPGCSPQQLQQLSPGAARKCHCRLDQHEAHGAGPGKGLFWGEPCVCQVPQRQRSVSPGAGLIDPLWSCWALPHSTHTPPTSSSPLRCVLPNKHLSPCLNTPHTHTLPQMHRYTHTLFRMVPCVLTPASHTPSSHACKDTGGAG